MVGRAARPGGSRRRRDGRDVDDQHAHGGGFVSTSGRQCGLWIDHRRAVIIVLEGEGAETATIESEVDRQHRAGGSRTSVPYGPQDAFPEDREQRKYRQSLRSYYREVAAALDLPGEIYVMGPGEAKGEFVKELGRELEPRVVAVEPADKMTEPQMVARVKAFFGERGGPA